MQNNDTRIKKYSEGIVKFEQFTNIVRSTLINYKFAKASFLKGILRCNEDIIIEAMEHLIINYIKENPSSNGKDVCEELFISIDYLNNLIDKGVIEIKPLSNEEILKMRMMEKEQSDINTTLYKRNTLQQLSNAFNQSNSTKYAENGNDRHKNKFHYIKNGLKR